ANHAVLPRLPPRPRAAPAPTGSNHEYGLEGGRESRSARPHLGRAIRHQSRPDHLLLRVPSMTKSETHHIDLARLRAAASAGGKRLWSSLEELADEESFRAWLAAEFPAAAAMLDEPGRRQFLKLMGASLLLAGLAGCSDEQRSEHALPYVNQPEEIIPGVPRYYATAVTFEGYAQPVIATTYAGRPTKLDGNP